MEQRDKRLLDLVEHPVFVIEPDEKGRARYAAMNRFALRMGGWQAADIEGKTALELYPGRLGRIAFDHHNKVLETGLPRSYELLLWIGGVQRHLRTTLNAVQGTDGRVLRVIGSSTELTEAQSMGEKPQASGLVEMEDFINLAAHDLRAPLRQVSVIAEMLREEFRDLGDGKIELIDMLDKVGGQAMELIGDILTLAQSTSDYRAPVVEFDLAGIVSETLAMLDPLGKCWVDCDQVLIRGDRMVTQMILRNLIDNAIKHAGCGHDLALGFAVSEIEEGMVTFHVTDDGGGFADPSLVMMRGGRLKTGCGFGLLGVRRLVHARGGTLSANNLPGGMAEVTFSLPGSYRMISAPRMRRVNSRILQFQARS